MNGFLNLKQPELFEIYYHISLVRYLENYGYISYISLRRYLFSVDMTRLQLEAIRMKGPMTITPILPMRNLLD